MMPSVRCRFRANIFGLIAKEGVQRPEGRGSKVREVGGIRPKHVGGNDGLEMRVCCLRKRVVLLEHLGRCIYLSIHHLMSVGEYRYTVLIQSTIGWIQLDVGIIGVVLWIPTVFEWSDMKLLEGRTLKRLDHNIEQWAIDESRHLELGSILLRNAELGCR